MDFGANKMPIEVIKQGAFEKISFRDFYSGVNETRYRSHGKNLIS